MTEITRLAKCRMELNMTQKQVADKARVPYPTYQKLDNGTTNFKKAQAYTALKIAQALGTTVEKLLRG
jgi:transcriptional regulator with XRE-family HTH domain